MLVQATFTGADGSLGYRKGQQYQLRVEEFRGLIVIERDKGAGRCLYSSLAALLRNWNGIKARG